MLTRHNKIHDWKLSISTLSYLSGEYSFREFYKVTTIQFGQMRYVRLACNVSISPIIHSVIFIHSFHFIPHSRSFP